MTHSVQRDVEEFHRVVVGIPDSETPAIRRPELRAELIREESKETVDAILAGDLIGAIDGMCDVLAVVYGTAAEFGIDLAPFWDEVHRTNMAKAGGPVREDGKRLKPEGWTPPDLETVLAAILAKQAAGLRGASLDRAVKGLCVASYYPYPGHPAGAPFCELPYGHDGNHKVTYPDETFVWPAASPTHRDPE